MSHGFDDTGNQFDKKGMLVDQLDNDTRKQFEERVKCLIDQYENYVDPQFNLKVIVYLFITT